MMKLLNSVRKIGAGVVAAALGVSGMTGCGAEDQEAVADGGFENGIMFNGIMFNGIMFNGIMFNGAFTGAIPGWLYFTSMNLGGYPVTGLGMSGNHISGWVKGVYTVGPGFGGGVVSIVHELSKHSGGDIYQFLLGAPGTIITGFGSQLTSYVMRWRSPGGLWQSMCPGGGPAVTLAGQWDPVTWDRISDEGVTFACVGGILADCAIWGYDPAAFAEGADYHAACMRAKPADYCGDRTPHTEDGTLVDFYDDLDIQTQASDWDLEAMWGEDGAICLNKPRKSMYTKDPNEEIYIGCEIPDCIDVNGDGEIDLDDYPDAKMATRANPS